MQASSVAERQTNSRDQTSFVAELASGTILVPVAVRNLWAAGCGVVIMSGDPDLPDKLSGRVLLHLPAVSSGRSGAVLPVTLRYVRSETRHFIFGLEFGPLLAHQQRKLQGVLEAIGQTD